MVEPLVVYRAEVLPEWIDFNGHMTITAYLMSFSKAADAFFSHLGIDEQYHRASGSATYATDSHIRYLQECFEGDPILIEAQILNHDEKRVHLFQRMRNRDTGVALATEETIYSHFVHEQGSPISLRGVPFEAGVRARLEGLMKQHKKIPWPTEAGAAIQLRSRR